MATAKTKTGFRGPAGAGMATRFKPGQVANPYGHGGKLRALRDAYKDDLAQIDPKTGLTYAQLVSKQVLKKALGGNMQAAMELANRTEGKPMQPISVQNAITEETAKELVEINKIWFGEAEFVSPDIQQPRPIAEESMPETAAQDNPYSATAKAAQKAIEAEQLRALSHTGKPFPSIG